jgi:CRISPR-associated protein, csd1 family
MSWLTELEKVYDNMIDKKTDDKPAPIYHISNNASVTVVLDGKGNFIKAELIDAKSKDRVTTMPCTDSCASRSSGDDPYPLCDKREYVYGDTEKRGMYINLLKSWACSAFANDKVKAVYTYAAKGTLAEDLKRSGIACDDVSDFIRWSVELPGDTKPELWKDEATQNSWIQYYNSDAFDEYCKVQFTDKKDREKRIRETGLNYTDGSSTKIAAYHPAKIRHGGDKAKIISSNDTQNYTFRGRFLTDKEACQVGADATQKAHCALRWLIRRQGESLGDGLSVVTWNAAGDRLPSIVEGSGIFDYGVDFAEESKTQKKEYKPAEEFAYAMNKRLVGYYGDIGNPQNIMILVIKEATPGQGRASIALYRELQNTDIVRALNKWYDGLLWYRSYWRRDRDGAGGCVHSIGTPSPKEIAECAYGERVKPNQIEKTVQRLLPCILDGSAIPFDLEQQCIQSASKLLTTDKSKRNSVLETACAVYKYNRNRIKEEYQLALEENRTSRDYLYGRLLAVAHQEEYRALKKMDPDSNRETNAMRYMQQFALRPATTWKLLYEQKLKPYRRHLSVKSVDYFERKVKDISDLFNVDDYINDSPLSGEYLLGYQCQLKAFEKSSDDTSNTNNNTEE